MDLTVLSHLWTLSEVRKWDSYFLFERLVLFGDSMNLMFYCLEGEDENSLVVIYCTNFRMGLKLSQQK